MPPQQCLPGLAAGECYRMAGDTIGPTPAVLRAGDVPGWPKIGYQ
jgi:hypothetical protein